MFLNKLKWSTLGTTAGFLGLGIGFMSIALRKQRERFIESKFHELVVTAVKQANPMVSPILGDIVRIERSELEYSNKEPEDGIDLRLKVSIRGTNDNAVVVAHGIKNETDKEIQLNKLEIHFEKIKGKKLALLNEQQQQLDTLVVASPHNNQPVVAAKSEAKSQQAKAPAQGADKKA